MTTARRGSRENSLMVSMGILRRAVVWLVAKISRKIVTLHCSAVIK
jgi:hypothetical protein